MGAPLFELLSPLSDGLSQTIDQKVVCEEVLACFSVVFVKNFLDMSEIKDTKSLKEVDATFRVNLLVLSRLGEANPGSRLAYSEGSTVQPVYGSTSVSQSRFGKGFSIVSVKVF